MVEVMDFEFVSVDMMYFEEKESRYGNTGFYYKGGTYNGPSNSVVNRNWRKVEPAVYCGGGCIMGCPGMVNDGVKAKTHEHMHMPVKVNQ